LDRLLIYIAVTLAIATVFFSISRLKPLVDYCSEARRLAGDMLTVYQSGGRMISEYRLSSVLVNGSGIFCEECGVKLKIPTLNNTMITGRARLEIVFIQEEASVSVYRARD
jgi:hypothetical protein